MSTSKIGLPLKRIFYISASAYRHLSAFQVGREAPLLSLGIESKPCSSNPSLAYRIQFLWEVFGLTEYLWDHCLRLHLNQGQICRGHIVICCHLEALGFSFLFVAWPTSFFPWLHGKCRVGTETLFLQIINLLSANAVHPSALECASTSTLRNERGGPQLPVQMLRLMDLDSANLGEIVP